MSVPALADDGGGSRAPDFRMRDIRGRRVELSKLLEDGPVLLDFWALWCGSCLKALPHLRDIDDAYRDRGLRIVAVNEDDMSSESKIGPFTRSKRLKFPVIIDKEKQLFRAYKVNTFPTLILINRDGTIHSMHTGYLPGDEAVIEARVRDALDLEPESVQ